MVQLGSAFAPLPNPESVDIDQPEDDALALRLELVLTALDNLSASLRELPTPQVFIDAPDLGAIVTAVNGLKPGVDADQIAQAVVSAIAPSAAKPEWETELVSTLKKLDFRLKAPAGGTSNANLPSLLSAAPASDTGQTALPVRIISQLGAGSGGGAASSVTVNDPTVTSQKLAIDASGRITVNQAGTVVTDVSDRAARLVGHVTVDSAPAVTGSVSVTNLPATQPVSGSVSVANFPATQPVSLATNSPDVTDRAARLLGHVTVDNASLAVTGAFFQTTQPVSAAALPLPTGASTETTLSALNTKLPTAAATADAVSNPTLTQLNSFNQLFNGSTWDRQRGMSVALTTGDTGAKTATGTGATQTNPGNKGAGIFIILGTVSGVTPTCVFKVQGSADGTNFFDIPGATTASLTTSVNVGIQVFPGVAVTAGAATTGTTASASQALPRFWRMAWTLGGTTPSFTITSITYNYLPY